MIRDPSPLSLSTQTGKPMTAEVISVGTEILQGEIVDTDSAYLAGRLRLLGIELRRISTVGDDMLDLTAALRTAWERSDVILTTGGLGPTADDLTREAIAALLGEDLIPDPALEQGLRERFARMGAGREMPSSNLKQALLIPSAKPLRNTEGTAPGWWIAKDGRILIALPGPPRELEPMWLNEVEPGIRHRSAMVILTRTFKIVGLSEAAVGEMVAPLFSVSNPYLGIYAKSDGIHLRFIATAEREDTARAMLAEGEKHVRAVLDSYIWGTDNDTLEGTVGRLMKQRGLTLAVAENYTAGLLTAILADLPESHACLKGGVTVSSDEARLALGIDSEVLIHSSAASPEAARAMAEAIRARFKADVGVGITAASTGEVETVCIGIAGYASGMLSIRPRSRRAVVNSALLELRRALLAER
ncbi:MAG: CinA family nicotinamide mononucleotide deamidase-related protein [Chloroflexi bacterium]|nr:CinA family nicotinamide mononucleotide deamidase-related protein [Chloroflexota bacterium]